MRIVLLGTGPFAVPSLQALVASEHEVCTAVSRPPRGRRAEPAPVTIAAEELGLATWLPETVNSPEGVSRLAELAAELLVVCDYGEILKPDALAATRLGGINLHGSLLPKYRGAAPVQWAVLSGDAETGNTVIHMTPGLDAGPILGVQRITIDPDETAGELEARMAQQGAALVLDVVDHLAAGTAIPLPQDKTLATKAPRLRKEDGQIDWSRTAVEIKNQIRALQPWPRAFTDWQRPQATPLRLILHRATVLDANSEAPPGTVTEADQMLHVATGGGTLQLDELQPAGKRAMQAADFLRGYPIAAGNLLG